ncbi:unnamed protein product [Cylindrotheca closterium]|uniref:Leucine-rich repeat protein n=1 Tax=Cylindrotheca closterium TaxID=2856 RepID=A0AAD2JIA3_9STRA|nr:unnamed protein product [Cylindrotheca closterium]
MRKSRLQMNPNFARAHGLHVCGDPTAEASRLETAIADARNSGHLRLNNAGIGLLTNEIFELRASLKVNLSMDNQQSAYQHTEDTLTVVDISDNDLITGDFDERFTRFTRVQKLYFKRCQLNKMTVSLTCLEFLKILDLSGNQLTAFDMNLLPPILHELNLSSNRLAVISSSDESATIQLQVFNISHNQLTHLNDCHISCPDLRVFRCHQNSFSRLPTEFLGASTDNKLESIDASYNMIAHTFDLSRYRSLKTLNIGMNRMTALPLIPNSLLVLDVTENRIKDIGALLPVSDASPPALIELMLSGNHLSEIDGSTVEKYSNLQRLDLSSNKLKNLPYQLGLLPKLRAFRVASNPLFTFKRSDVESNPDEVLAVLRRRAPKREEALHSQPSSILSAFISNGNSIVLSAFHHQGQGVRSSLSLDPLVRSLKANPVIASKITNKLELHGFDSIPGDLISTIRDVSNISLSANKLSLVPPQLATCPRLVHLDLSKNQLSDFSPLIVGDLLWANTIELLDLGGNCFTEVPIEVLAQLKCLKTLNLLSNKIKSLERCTAWLPASLVHLELSENQIEDMEDLVWSLALSCPNIQVLQIAQNKLKKIPLELGLFLEGKLRKLNLQMNPQQAVRHAVLERGCADQLSYLKHRMTKEAVLESRKRLVTLQDALQAEKQSLSLSNTVVKHADKTEEIEGFPIAHTTNQGASNQSIDSSERLASLKLIAECKERIDDVQQEIDTNFALSQAKRYALKKKIAMERSQMIKEERKLGLRK